MNNLYISDQFETWQKCRKQYYYKYVKKLNFPVAEENFELGKTVHTLVFYKLKGFDTSNFETNLDKDIFKHWDALKKHPIFELEPIVYEWGFNSRVKDSNYWLNGRIDAVFYDKSIKKYIIVDWKTGQNIPKNAEKSFQCKIYLNAFFNARKDLNLDIKHSDVIFQFIKTPDFEEIEPIEYSQEKNDEYENEFKLILDEINSTDYFPKCSEKISKNCKYCNYKSLCFR